MNRLAGKTVRGVVGFAVAGVIAFSLGAWRAAEGDCFNGCHMGICWKFSSMCVKADEETCTPRFGVVWATDAGGMPVVVDAVNVTYYPASSCTPECTGLSRASGCGGEPEGTNNHHLCYCSGGSS